MILLKIGGGVYGVWWCGVLDPDPTEDDEMPTKVQKIFSPLITSSSLMWNAAA